MSTSSADSSRFRRPAPLFPSRADAIPGEPDPSTRADLAHDSAQALLHGVFTTAEPDVVERVLRLVETEGLTELAALWSGAPPSSLPGALWRLYVLHTWVQRDPQDVITRYQAGAQTVPGLRYLAGVAEPPDIDQVRRTMDEILRGAFTGDLGVALSRAGALAVIAAHGTAHLADDATGEEPQRDLTQQAERLLTTGEDLGAAARTASAGHLL